MIQVTEEITLSLISESDTQDVFGAINTYRNSLRTWLPFVDGTHSPADTEAFIRFTNEIGEKTFVIRDRKHIFVGLIGLKGIERDGELLVSGFTDIVSYGLLKKEWNGSN